jgi:invasion protein IalB
MKSIINSSRSLGAWYWERRSFSASARSPSPKGQNLQRPQRRRPSPDPSRSLVDAAPTSTSASFGDWVLRCQRIGNGAEMLHVCEVAQQIRAQDQQNPLAEVAIGRLKKSDPLLRTVVLPVNVTFPNAPSFSPDASLQNGVTPDCLAGEAD